MGGLGRAVTKCFRQQSWHVIGCDMQIPPDTVNAAIEMKNSESLSMQGRHAVKAIEDSLKSIQAKQVDAVICVAGGFAMGPPGDENFLEEGERMVTSSVMSSLLAAHIAARFLKPKGLFVLPGAAIAESGPTPLMGSYGSSKAFVHHLGKSLGAEGSGMPPESKTIILAPTTIDTEGNRNAMPDADTSTWTSPDEIADVLFNWSCSADLMRTAPTPDAPLETGSVVQPITKNGETEWAQAGHFFTKGV
uniref:Dihydropteridine reductase n=1 Tax=Chromera velia CCMP2878 TaxID=1169474 RepID=A0A0G4GIU1_9ALVE|eukprot:Cvel_22087.t1-p1 / transcript=Cvel_22087.t1 / gene=Cvel_22087 / organism=Chromera_velia_CCMP2878 / gene_product=Dihydropteridine reductase, putative / transcript_product=Dihydropteridine reductase, putative / location=Cvel_scaffold2136:4450-7738(+) / protein_length=247 / sequence_SO=supercontig / SO=protein_coding / is_pseudo=false